MKTALKIFKIILSTISILLGFFLLIVSIFLINENEGIEVIILSLLLALVFLFLPFILKKYLTFIKNIKEEKNSKKEELKKRGFLNICQNVDVSEKEKLIVLNNNEYSFKKILGAELIEDENTITVTNGRKNASVGKALVGGALFGGVGALVGGNSGKIKSTSISNNYCTTLKVKIKIDNISNPCEFINLIDYRTNRESKKYKQAFENAQKILSMIDIIVSKN